MKILISPAKSLDYTRSIPTPEPSRALFLQEANYLANKLRKMSPKQLGKLMHLSPQLAELNYERYQSWVSPEKPTEITKPAITVFTGEVYKGLDVETFSQKDFENAQKQLYILSGLYGVLKPLDLMYPYRLEMGTNWSITPKTKNLYNYWGKKISELINSESDKNEVVINLSSNEYFKSIDKKTIKPRIITPVFKELKGDKYSVVMIYAKHARGAMARDIILNQYSTPEDLKGYNIDSYSDNEALSSENEWVFVR